MVVDDAFLLRKDLMKPSPFRNLSHEKRVFIYQLSRVKRVAENVSGIVANRFRMILSPKECSPKNVEKVTLASCCTTQLFT